MRAAKRKQIDVATAAGLEQSAISKLIHNQNLGPSVEIFLNAIEGLGMRASDFFAQLERAAGPPPSDSSDVDLAVFVSHEEERTRDLARRLRKMIREEIRDIRNDEPRRSGRRAARRTTPKRPG